MGDISTGAIITADIIAGAAFATLITLVAGDYIDLANDYYHLYRDQRNYYYNTFQQQGELPLANELYNVPFYVPLYTAGGTWVSNGVVTNSSIFYYEPQAAFQANVVFGNTLFNHLKMYNSNFVLNVPALLELSEISDDWRTYFYRYEEHRRDVYNARRYAQQMDSDSFGVKEGAQITRGLATSFAAFDEAQGHIVSALDNSVDDIFAYTAYRKQIREQLEVPKALPDNKARSNFDTSVGPRM